MVNQSSTEMGLFGKWCSKQFFFKDVVKKLSDKGFEDEKFLEALLFILAHTSETW